MKAKKEKLISFRIPKELYNSYLTLALEKSKTENKVITISEIIRHTLITNLNNEKIND